MGGLPHFFQHCLVSMLTPTPPSKMVVIDCPWWEIGMTSFVSSLSKYCPNLFIGTTRICDCIDPCMEGSSHSQNEGPSSTFAIKSN